MATNQAHKPIENTPEHTAPPQPLHNWAGNITFSTGHIVYPDSVEQVQALVQQSPSLRVLGSGHSFNPIADSPHILLSTNKLNKVLSLDEAALTVTVEGGITYGALCPWLDAKGFALHNLASLPHISVAGSVATATHGSGVTNGNLATAVTALEMVLADGSIRRLSKEQDADQLAAAVVGLGALGVVTQLTLRVQPRFHMQQYVYEHLPLAQLTQHFHQVMAAGYSVSLFTDWQQDSINEVWIKTMAGEGHGFSQMPLFFGATAARHKLHPIAGVAAENCTDQLGLPGPWYERLPHFKMGFMPSNGEELQSEYFVPAHHAVEALQALAALGKQTGPHLLISEIRSIAADELWLSPSYQQDTIAFHFTWKQHIPEVMQLLPLIEGALAPFRARPHWGKLFTIPPAVLEERYEKWAAFKQMATQLDPRGKFRNPFLEQQVFGMPAASQG
ncbi:FAD-binding protein [Paraflavitalea soli]|uniref:FAD-binding protein n=1 Tax=Paraflavitalea soli TaxID=2315862 RepID=A0A3B7MHB2_9BACT|nr:FAD-binding protein [Paraflavitalea soli]AXY72703.1 FAD-binding protein [Paraflavitalea soli]